ncbi:BA3454 family stress response protein [Mesobacillus foraminis]|nr:BA3454 family stress response protein [Mesobacillus foraminis]MBT2757749.1 BA3454 family stress response protein [Mesobacillus foraminis]
MKEVFVTVNYKNRNYITNVIVSKEMNREHIQRLAEEQVLKQWGA